MFTYPIGLLNPNVGGIHIDGLQAEWLFAGGSLLDTSDNSYNGTAFNSPTLVNGINGEANGAYHFIQGSLQYLNFGAISEIQGVNKLSISSWYKKAGNTTISASNFTGTFGSFNGWISDGNAYILIYNSTNGVELVALSGFNVWKHVVIVYDYTEVSVSDRMKIYINGVEGSIFAGGASSLTYALDTDFQIGRYGAIYNTGDVARVRVYDTALTQTQVNLLYAEKTV